MSRTMAIIGDDDSIFVFSAVGVDPYLATENTDVFSLIKKLAKIYKIIFVTEDIAIKNKEIIDRYKAEVYPIILSIPSKNGDSAYSENLIKDAMIKALGVDLFLNEKNDEEGR